MKGCSFEELELGMRHTAENRHIVDYVDMSAVAICRKIRKLARVAGITVIYDGNSDDNILNLFAYLKYCGMDYSSYMKEYLYNLQPYMIERNLDAEYGDNVIAIIDKLYNISVCIKTECDPSGKELAMVSFHEDCRLKNGVPASNGMSRTTNMGLLDDNDTLVPVFKDSYRAVNQADNSAIINIYAQRGLLSLRLAVNTRMKCGDMYIVRKRDIEDAFLTYCNTYIEDLYASDLHIDFSQIDMFTMLQQVSSTRYGRDTFSSISLLIDGLLGQSDQLSRRAADFALVTFVKNLKLTKDDREELVGLLYEKYKITNEKEISLIIGRIKTFMNEI